MASLGRSTLLPQCSSCIRRVTRLAYNTPGPQQQRNLSKAAREAERNIVVKLIKDVPKYGRSGSLVPINPATMRNRWFPMRFADYVPFRQLKELKAQGVHMERDTEFGVRRPLEETEADEGVLLQQPKHYVRPVEIEMLSPQRSMELITAFIPPTIDFARQPIEQDQTPAGKRFGASDAADVLTAAAMASKPKLEVNGIYGSVSTADVVATIKSALAHNDEAARVLLSEDDVRFMDGHAEGDASRVKKLGTFKVQIRVPGADEGITRSIRVRAKEQ